MSVLYGIALPPAARVVCASDGGRSGPMDNIALWTFIVCVITLVFVTVLLFRGRL